jgi:hypothetical protein
MDWGDLAVSAEMVNSISFCWLTRILKFYDSFNTLTRETPVALLQDYMTFTAKPIRILRVDNAKEFTCPAMVAFCWLSCMHQPVSGQAALTDFAGNFHTVAATPGVWMFDMISRTITMVFNFKAYPAHFLCEIRHV